jgi:hypothetical protein
MERQLYPPVDAWPVDNNLLFSDLLGRFAVLASDLGVPAEKQGEARSVLYATFQRVLDLALAKASGPSVCAPVVSNTGPFGLTGALDPGSVEAVVHDFAKSITRVRMAFDAQEAQAAQARVQLAQLALLSQPSRHGDSPRSFLTSYSSDDSENPRGRLSSRASEDPASPTDEDPVSSDGGARELGQHGDRLHAGGQKHAGGPQLVSSPQAADDKQHGPHAETGGGRTTHLPWLAIEDFLVLACERRWVDNFGRRSRAYGCSKWRFVALVLHATLNRLKIVPEMHTVLARTERSLRSRCGHLVAQDTGAWAQHREAYQNDATVHEALDCCWLEAMRKVIKM